MFFIAMLEQTPIDLAIVCGARPSLLRRTLESFDARVFRHFEIANVFANIDAFQGGPREVEECESAVRQYFPKAEIRTPETPSYTDAVKWLWTSIRSPYCLHIEDDWQANLDIKPRMVFPHFDDQVRQVAILTREKNWSFQTPFHHKHVRRQFLGMKHIFGMKFGSRLLLDEPLFTVSPCFTERVFANRCAAMMDLAFDPEKQLHNGLNEPLRAYTKQFKSRFIGGDDQFLIEDIGREYRRETGLEKSIIAGQSVWHPA
jgi:hypothetical protein